MVWLFRPYKYTRGFEDYEDFRRHFRKHKSKLSIKTEIEYARLADKLCGGPRDANTDEAIRVHDNAKLRYNNATNVFGVLRPDNVIGTCFWSNTGRRYYEDECQR